MVLEQILGDFEMVKYSKNIPNWKQRLKKKKKMVGTNYYDFH